MATAYPSGLDDWGNPDPTTRLDDPTLGHAAAHTNLNDAVEAIEAELGTNPSGGSATVAARLSAFDTALGGKVDAATFNAHTILAATADNTPAAVTVAEGTLLGRATGGSIAALSAADARTLLGVSTGGGLDLTANSIHAAGADGVDAALSVGESTLVGRAPGGAVAALSAETARTILGVSTAGATDDTGYVDVETYSSGTDEEKLTAAMSYAAAQTYKPTLRLSRRLWTFTTTRTLYTGFKITGAAPGASVEQPRTNNPYATQVKVNRGSDQPWLTTPAGAVYGCYIGNMAVEGTSSSVFLGSGGGVLWTSVLENLGFSLFKHVLGTPTAKLLLTATTFKGFWNINNSYNVAVTLGGSDNTLWADGCLLDSPTAFTSGGAVPYHMWLDYLEKTVIGPMFITCEGIPAGIRITGNDSNPALILTGLKIEGRNSGAYSNGSVVRVEGGRTTFRDCWFGYGYGNSGASGRSGEGGVISVLGGRVLIDGGWYARAVAETVPWVYASGAGTVVRIRNAETGHDGGSFTGLPRVTAVSSAVLNVDDSVTVV